MPLKNPGKKNTFIVLAATLLIIAGYFFYKFKKQSFLNHQLKTLVAKKTNRIYSINYDSISVNEIEGDVYIKNIYIKGDTAREMQMIAKGDTNAFPVIFDIYIPLLRVVKFKTAAALLQKQMECSQIIISDPQVQVYIFPGQHKHPSSQQYKKEIYKQILGSFSLIKADSVSILNSAVHVSDFYSKDLKFKTVHTNIELRELAVDSTYNEDTTRTLFCKKITVTSDKILAGSKNNVAEIANAVFNTEEKVLHLTSLSYDAFKNNGFFKSTIRGISLKGFEWKGPIENSELAIDSIVINKGNIEMSVGEQRQKKKKPSKILTGWIERLSVNNILVKSIDYVGKSREVKTTPFIVKNNSFTIHHISLNRASQLDEKLFSGAKELVITNDQINIKSGDGRYRYEVRKISANTRSREIRIKSVRVVPQFDETTFARIARYQTDRYDIQINDIVCSNINIEKLIRGEIEIKNISTNRTLVKIFRDLSYPIDSISKSGQQLTYPHQVIQKLGFAMKINKFYSNNTLVEYKEKNPKFKNSGRVRFSNSTIVINNISNVQHRRGEKMTVTFKSNFLDKIPVTGGFTFLLDRWQKGSFTATASVKQTFEASLINELTQPMALIKIEKGVIGPINFYMKADTNTSNGKLIMPYHDLKISLLRFQDNRYNEKNVFSLFANLIVKNNNNEGERMRTGQTVLQRNKYRSFFNFIWSTLFTGLKDIGLLKL
jgi:hypothetical protein